VAGVPLDNVLIDRDHRTARVRATPLPGATLRAYQELEARVAAGENDWTVLLIPPAATLPDVPPLADSPGIEEQAALATIIWGAKRLDLPVGVTGADAVAIIQRLRSAGVDARGTGATTGPNRVVWLAPGAEPAR
jgi:hypothetical protein